jgi:hypothetical protein
MQSSNSAVLTLNDGLPQSHQETKPLFIKYLLAFVPLRLSGRKMLKDFSFPVIGILQFFNIQLFHLQHCLHHSS